MPTGKKLPVEKFDTIYLQEYKSLKHFALQIISSSTGRYDPELAEDVIHETFRILWEKSDDYLSSPSPWCTSGIGRTHSPRGMPSALSSVHCGRDLRRSRPRNGNHQIRFGQAGSTNQKEVPEKFFSRLASIAASCFRQRNQGGFGI